MTILAASCITLASIEPPPMKEKILLSASLFHALNDAATVILPMVFPILLSRGYLITSYSDIGLLSNLGLLTTFLVQIAVVLLAERVEYRVMVLVSFLGICFSLALFTLSSSFFLLLLFFLVMRAFTGFYHPIGIAWVSKSHAVHGIDSAMGIQSASGNLGVFLGFISMGYLLQRFDWKPPLVVWSVLGLAIGSMSYLAIRKTSSRSLERHKFDMASWLDTFKKIRLFVPGFIFGGIGWPVVVYFAPSLLNHKFGIPMGQTGLYLGLWIGIGSINNYGFGKLSRRLGRANVLVVSLGGGSLCLLIIGLASRKALAVAGLLGFGAFLFLVYPALQTFVGYSVASRHQTQAFSLESNFQMVAGALLSLISGFLSDKYGIGSPFLVTGILGILITGFYCLRWPRPADPDA